MLNIQQKKMLGLSAFALLFSVLFKEKCSQFLQQQWRDCQKGKLDSLYEQSLK